MTKEAVVKLFRATQSSPDLKKRLNSSPDLEAFIAKAKTYGYEFTAQEWKEVTSFTVEELKGDLSEIPGI